MTEQLTNLPDEADTSDRVTHQLHVILCSIGSHGDVHPFVGLGRELLGRGHRVTLATNSYFEPLVRRAGLEFVEIGTAEEFHRLTENAEIWHPTKGWKAIFTGGVFPAMQQMYDAMQRVASPAPTVIGASTLAFGARVFGEKHGVPVLSIHLAPLVFRSYYQTPKFSGPHPPAWLPIWAKRWLYGFGDRFVVEPVLAPAINAFRAEHGLTELDRAVLDWIHSPDGVIGLFPEWFAPPQPDWPANTFLTGFPLYDESDHQSLDPGLESFLSSGTPPIAFTPGSAMKQGQAFFAASVEACERLGRRGLLLSRHAEQIPAKLPPSVRHVPFAPFGTLLPRCAALVHHGGIGTAAQGLASAVPQLVMPLSHDQPDNAQRLIRMGVADEISPRKYDGQRVAKKLARLLDSPTVQASCRELAARVRRMRPLAQTCEIIERHAREPALGSH